MKAERSEVVRRKLKQLCVCKPDVLGMLWSTLLKRVFEVDGFECPLCDQPMRLQAVVLPPATLQVLDGLELAYRGTPQQGAA